MSHLKKPGREGTELLQFQNGERTSKLYLSKPTWDERQTFYSRTARATLINFEGKAIEVVFQNLRDLRDEMITT